MLESLLLKRLLAPAPAPPVSTPFTPSHSWGEPRVLRSLPPPRRLAPQGRLPHTQTPAVPATQTHSLSEVVAGCGCPAPSPNVHREARTAGVSTAGWSAAANCRCSETELLVLESEQQFPTLSPRPHGQRGGSLGGSDSPSSRRAGVCGERALTPEGRATLRLGGRITETCCKVREAAGSGAGRAGAHRSAATSCHHRGRVPRRDVGVSPPALTETARRAQLAASEQERAPRLRRGGRRAGSPAQGRGTVRNHSPGGWREAPARAGGAEHCGRHRTARLPRTVKRRGKRGAGARRRRARGPPASGGEGRPARRPAGHGDAAPKVAPDPRTRRLRPGFSQRSAVSLPPRPLAGQPAIVMISWAPAP